MLYCFISISQLNRELRFSVIKKQFKQVQIQLFTPQLKKVKSGWKKILWSHSKYLVTLNFGSFYLAHQEAAGVIFLLSCVEPEQLQHQQVNVQYK